jgi:branched-chain amino acid transport system ATP-binding protein
MLEYWNIGILGNEYQKGQEARPFPVPIIPSFHYSNIPWNEMMVILEGKGLTKYFRGLSALQSVDFKVEEGSITGLIGPNGAGKTTLFNLISGVFSPNQGTTTFRDINITHLRADRICHLGISRTYQLIRPFLGLSVLKNVLVGIYYGRDKSISTKKAEEEAWSILEFMDLSSKAAYRADQLNTGERKRLEISRALGTNPRVLLLDEVIAGLNPSETATIMKKIESIRGKGVTVFMIEHVMKAVMGLSDKVIVLHHGEKIAEGTPQEVSIHPRVMEAYLGEKRI